MRRKVVLNVRPPLAANAGSAAGREARAYAAALRELETARANTAKVHDALKRRARALDVEGARATLARLKKYADAQDEKYTRLEAAAHALRKRGRRMVLNVRPPVSGRRP